MKHVAIVGGGIAGLVAAYTLRGRARVTLYEAAPRLGGHVHAVEVPGVGPVETGFLAFHRSHYPLLAGLLDAFGIETGPSGVGLAIQDGEQVFSSQDWFGRVDRAQLADLMAVLFRQARRPEAEVVPNVQLAEFLAARGYSDEIARHVVVPSIAALWGFQPAQVLAMSARTVADNLNRFFHAGSDEPFERIAPHTGVWLERLVGSLDATLRLGHPVASIGADGSVDGQAYDAVIVATHADTALSLLAEPSALHAALLGAFPSHVSVSILHQDDSYLPALRTDYTVQLGDPTLVTWDMRRIQGLGEGPPVLVTVGPPGFTGAGLIDPARVVARLAYKHPAGAPSAVAARPRLAELNSDPLYFAGAYFGATGSNECAAASGLRAAQAYLTR